MKLKYLFATSLFLLSAAGFGSTFSSYSCGNPSGENALNWCGCYAGYLKTSCTQMGGNNEDCKDDTIRQYINDFGGPASVCDMVPPPDLTPEQCVLTLNYYLTNCPILNHLRDL